MASKDHRENTTFSQKVDDFFVDGLNFCGLPNGVDVGPLFHGPKIILGLIEWINLWPVWLDKTYTFSGNSWRCPVFKDQNVKQSFEDVDYYV